MSCVPKKATSKTDLSIYCYKVPDEVPPSDNTVALAIAITLGSLVLICIVGLLIFFFKRKPPTLPFKPNLPNNLKSESGSIT